MPQHEATLPPPEHIRAALAIYLEVAYPDQVPASVAGRLPPPAPEPLDVEAWLGGDAIERAPPGAAPAQATSLACRLGNARYPHMKLRLSRPPRDRELLFSVDSHDGFLTARAPADAAPLEELKRHNAEVARVIHHRWEEAGVPTERSYLRAKVAEARQRAQPE